jgi:hypothetical protein
MKYKNLSKSSSIQNITINHNNLNLSDIKTNKY